MNAWFAYRLAGGKPVFGVIPSNAVQKITQPSALPTEENGFVFAPFSTSAGFPILFFPTKQTEFCTAQHLETLPIHLGRSNFPEPDTKESYCDRVEKVAAICRKGPFQKAVLSRIRPADIPTQHPISIFEKLNAAYPNANILVISAEECGTWATATPELLLRAQGNRFETMSLAGTRAAGTDGTWGAKELKEQHLVTAYLFDRLQALHATSLEVFGPTTARAGNIEHLKTTVLGRIDSTLPELIQTLHPTPAVCGYPAEEAGAFLEEEEASRRAYYAGFWGAYQPHGETQLFVNLRCMEFGNQAFLHVGGGILADSVPELEWQETELKAKTLLSVLS